MQDWDFGGFEKKENPLDQIAHSLIVGCWQLDDRGWKAMSEEDVARALDHYLDLGVNTFDTADMYGRSEELLGRLLKGKNCQVFTKIIFFENYMPMPGDVRGRINNALQTLQRDHLDCVQVHWQKPQVEMGSAFVTLREMVDSGKIRKLAVTNFDTPMLEKALDLAPVCAHQVQYSLIDRRVEGAMQALCRQRNVDLLAYGPLAGGYLSDRFRGMSSMQGEPNHARGFYYNTMIRAHGGWSAVSKMLEVLAEVGQKYNKTVSQVALNWVLNRDAVKAVICGLTLDPKKIQDNVEAMSFKMELEDMQYLSKRSTELFVQQGGIYSYER